MVISWENLLSDLGSERVKKINKVTIYVLYSVLFFVNQIRFTWVIKP